mmetsp:Transcript_40617/g.73124  ORF Transcript_40617/g.73124 Transcript_40617/m.73124 type:complete len:417 (+) Transcript_40617:26-1276(+)
MGGPDAGGGKGFARRHGFKVLCPDELVARVLGARGARKDQMQDETRCTIKVSARDEYFPGTALRIMTIYSETADGPMAVIERLVYDVIECATKDSLPPGASESDFLGSPGQYVLRTAVSKPMSSAIIGPRGANVRAIREESGAKVVISPDVVAGHQMVTVTAEPGGMKLAFLQINRHVQANVDSQAYDEWLQARPADAGAVASSSHAVSTGKGGSLGKGSDRQVHRERSPRRTAPPMPADTEVDPSLLQALGATAQQFLPGALEMEYTITCELPKEKVSQLIGKGGGDVQRIRKATGTGIHFDVPEEGMSGQTLQIKGPLLKIYRAHALLMRRYHETDAEDGSSKQPISAPVEHLPPASRQLEDHIQGLQRQIAEAESLRKLVNPPAVNPPPLPPPEAIKKGPKGRGKGKKGRSRT